jgi:hypothetical protein
VTWAPRAGFARHDLGLANRVEQRGLAVVDVAHHGDDRRTLLEILRGVLELGLGDVLLGGRNDLDLAVERVGEHLDRLVGERLGERRHLPTLHQLLDQLRASQVERLGDLLHRRTGIDLGRIRFGNRRGLGRWLEKGSPPPSTPAPRWPPRGRLRHVLTARRLRIDDHSAALPAGPRRRPPAGGAHRPRTRRCLGLLAVLLRLALRPTIGLGGRIGLRAVTLLAAR